MKVLVTGGAGYVGAVTVDQLLRDGHEVRVLDSLLHGGQALPGLYPRDGFSFIRGDVRSAETLRQALAGMEAVVHLAAIVGDPACKRELELARAVNQDASLQLFRLAGSLGIGRFVFVSTCSNYGKMADPTGLVTEDAELRPVSLYAETKVAVERALLNGPLGGPLVTVLRFATVYGVSPRMRFDLTVNEFTLELLTRRELEVYGEQFWRPYLHVRDAARAVNLVLAAPAERIAGRVYNVGDTEQNFTKAQLVELIRREIGGDAVLRQVRIAEDPRDYRVSFERIRSELGFGITRTVEDGIREVIDIVRQGVITDFADPGYRN